MKLIVSTAAALVAFAPLALAQTAPTPAPTATPAASASRLSLDTPIESIVADPAGKVALEKTLPGVTEHAHYSEFKAMSLRAIQPLSGGQLTEEMLKKLEADLAAVK